LTIFSWFSIPLDKCCDNAINIPRLLPLSPCGLCHGSVGYCRPLTVEDWIHVHVGYVMEKVALGQVFLQDLRCPPINLLKPNDIYICHYAVLTSRRYILNIYLTNIHTEYFKHAA